MIELIASLYSNPVFSGVVGGSLVVSLLFLVKWVPETLWKLVVWRFTSTVTIQSDDAIFETVNDWLGGLAYAKRARLLQLDTHHQGEDERIVYSPGLGKHLIRHAGRFLLVERSTPKDAARGWRRSETLSISVLGASVTGLHQVIAELVSHKAGHHRGVDVFLYREYWRRVCRKPKRSLDTIYIPSTQKAEIVADIETFLGAQSRYEERGIPYRRGLLFEGPPGTGKTSLVLALAAHFKRPIYALNLGSLKGDDDLINAVTSAPSHCILLIEDIDAASATAARGPDAPTAAGESPKEEARQLSLSGLLNALDGTFSRDGRILIMTTNHPDKVDAALIRRGRVDRREHIGLIDAPEARRMCRAHLDEVSAERFLKGLALPIAPAELQELLLREAA